MQEAMEFIDLLGEMLDISKDFAITKIEKDEANKIIRIHLMYRLEYYREKNNRYRLYDQTPEREWQHLSWFNYQTYLVCSLPRYLDDQGKPKVIEPSFAPKGKGYTHLFAETVIEYLQRIRVQSTVAKLLGTTAYMVRNIMEQAVETALIDREWIIPTHVTLDEKSYAQGHEYATILADTERNYVIEMTQGRKKENVECLFFCVTDQRHQPQLKQVNMDMWPAYIQTIQKIAPQATIVYDKFHLFKMLTDAINKTRQQEVPFEPALKRQRFTVLKNPENRTEKQRLAFEKIDQANLKTAQAWHIRESFKAIFQQDNKDDIAQTYSLWVEKAKASQLKYVLKVVETFERHKEGILNAAWTQSSSAKLENLNGRIQSVIAKARGFLNFDRFRINTLFYFGNLNFSQKF
jgi:transposase